MIIDSGKCKNIDNDAISKTVNSIFTESNIIGTVINNYNITNITKKNLCEHIIKYGNSIKKPICAGTSSTYAIAMETLGLLTNDYDKAYTENRDGCVTIFFSSNNNDNKQYYVLSFREFLSLLE